VHASHGPDTAPSPAHARHGLDTAQESVSSAEQSPANESLAPDPGAGHLADAATGTVLPGSGSSTHTSSLPAVDARGQNTAASTSICAGTSQQQQRQAPPPSPERACTRLCDDIRRPRVYRDGTIHYGLHACVGEPLNLVAALSGNNWKKAMDDEFDALIKKKTWHLVPPQKGSNVIDYKWYIKSREKLIAA
jgi:hypothetical protein